MNPEKLKDLSTQFMQAQYNFNNKKLTQLEFSAQVQALEKEGKFYNISPNSIANHAMQNFADFEKKQQKKIELAEQAGKINYDFRTGVILENMRSFKMDQLKKEAATHGISYDEILASA